MASEKWIIWCTDRTDGTKWNMTEYAYSAQEAREKAIARIAPHVTINRVYQEPKP